MNHHTERTILPLILSDRECPHCHRPQLSNSWIAVCHLCRLPGCPRCMERVAGSNLSYGPDHDSRMRHDLFIGCRTRTFAGLRANLEARGIPLGSSIREAAYQEYVAASEGNWGKSLWNRRAEQIKNHQIFLETKRLLDKTPAPPVYPDHVRIRPEHQERRLQLERRAGHQAEQIVEAKALNSLIEVPTSIPDLARAITRLQETISMVIAMPESLLKCPGCGDTEVIWKRKDKLLYHNTPASIPWIGWSLCPSVTIDTEIPSGWPIEEETENDDDLG